MKFPKIPRTVWILAGVGVGAYLLVKLAQGEGLGPSPEKGLFAPETGPGLYTEWTGTYWGAYDGEAKVCQARIGLRDARGWSIALDGGEVVVRRSAGEVSKVYRSPRRRNPGSAMPPIYR